MKRLIAQLFVLALLAGCGRDKPAPVATRPGFYRLTNAPSVVGVPPPVKKLVPVSEPVTPERLQALCNDAVRAGANLAAVAIFREPARYRTSLEVQEAVMVEWEKIKSETKAKK